MEAPDRIRLDKWLWQARFFKTRGLASRMIEGGKVRVDGRKLRKPGTGVKVGDTLTFVQGDAVRVVTILSLGDRRGPASEARMLYEDVDTPS